MGTKLIKLLAKNEIDKTSKTYSKNDLLVRISYPKKIVVCDGI